MATNPSHTISPAALLRKFHDTLRGSKHTSLALGEARRWLPPSLYGQGISWLLQQPKLKNKVYPFPFPSIPAEIYRYGPLAVAKPTRELAWSAALLAAHSSRITEFVRLRGEFEDAALLGKTNEIVSALDSLRQAVGISYWWIAAKTAAIQLAEGLEQQKKFSASIRREASQKGVTSYVAYQVSVRNEPSVTPSRFVVTAEQEIDGLPNLSTTWKNFVKYHVLGATHRPGESALEILRHSCAASMIDAYEAYLFACRCIVAENDTSLFATALTTVNSLRGTIVDVRLDRLASMLANGCEIDNVACDGLEEQLVGDETGSRQTILGNLTSCTAFPGFGIVAGRIGEFPQLDDIPFYSLASRNLGNDADPVGSGQTSSAITPSLLIDIVKWTREVLRRGKDAENARTELSRACINFSGFWWAEYPMIAANLALGPVLPDFPRASIETPRLDVLTQLEKTMLFVTAIAPQTHPTGLESFFPAFRNDAVNVSRLEGRVKEYALCLTQSPPAAVDRLSADERNRQLCLGFARGGDWNGVVEASTPLLASAIEFYKAEGIRLKIVAHLNREELELCVDFATLIYVADPHLNVILPLKEIADRIDRPVLRANGSNISYAVLLDMYARHIGTAYEARRRSAYESFMRSRGVKRPTMLRVQADELNLEKLVYFLSRICVPEMMYLSGGFTAANDLQNERISILKWLCEVDRTHEQEYQNEILDRTRELVLQGRRLEIESSKLHLDNDGLFREANRRQRESFERYRAFRHADVGPEESDKISSAIAQAQAGNTDALLALSVPTDEPRALFNSMVRDLRDNFVYNDVYGLDGLLSTRIRHATLENELRAPLATHRLVTTKSEASGEYQSNSYWLAHVGASETPAAAKIDRAFQELSSGIDTLIAQICGEWVQVKGEQGGRGMIDLSLSDQVLAVLQQILPVDAGFDTFVAIITGTLLQRLKPSLELIRARLDSQAKPTIDSLLNRLKGVVEAESARVNPAELLTAIETARNAVDQAVDRIASWFVLVDGIVQEPLPLSDAIEICVQVAQRIYPGFTVKRVLSEVTNLQVAGAQLASFVDAVLILFGNAHRYGDRSHGYSISIVAKRTDDSIGFEVTNKTDPSQDLSAGETRVAKIMEGLSDRSYLQSLRMEKGTGLHKLYKILRFDFSAASPLEAYFVDHREFRVEFSIPLRSLDASLID